MTKEFTLRTDPNALTLVAITVSAAASTGTSAADTALIGGRVLSNTPTGNQDQFVDNVAIATSTGIVTVTLAANATADNTFNVLIQKA